MEYAIVSKESFPIIGVELKTTIHHGRNFVEIPRFWEKVLAEGRIDNIPNKKSQSTLLGVCLDYEDSGEFSYIIGSEVTSTEGAPQDMVCRTIPGACYAVFTVRGRLPDSVQDAVKYIYYEWLPNSEFHHAKAADFELYDERCIDAENAEVELYVPIVSSGQTGYGGKAEELISSAD